MSSYIQENQTFTHLWQLQSTKQNKMPRQVSSDSVLDGSYQNADLIKLILNSNGLKFTLDFL